MTTDSHTATDQLTDSALAILPDVLRQVDAEAAEWQPRIAVSIGRAAQLTTLHEGQIRYFERLGALQPVRVGTGGKRREYSLADLRRLRTLALLLGQPMPGTAAAEFVRKHAHWIDQRQLPDLQDALIQAQDVAVDGFLLTRLLAQIRDVAEQELRPNRIEESSTQPRVIGVILPDTRLSAQTVDSANSLARQLIGQPGIPALVALPSQVVVTTHPPPEDEQATARLWPPDAPPTPFLLFSQGAWTFPRSASWASSLYNPTNPALPSLLFLVSPQAGVPPTLPTRAGQFVLEHLLSFCQILLPGLRQALRSQPAQFHADGYSIPDSIRLYKRVIQLLLQQLFPEDTNAHGALLVPDDLQQPKELVMLAPYNYSPEFVRQAARLPLHGASKGLTTRAWKTGEPYFTLDAAHDDRVAFWPAENSHCALAIPLLGIAGMPPVGVLYLATSLASLKFRSEQAYIALVIGNLLAEHLGQWWLTRTRKMRDDELHHYQAQYIGWLDAMDAHGYDLDRAYDQLQTIWATANAWTPRQWELGAGERLLSLIVLDIDGYDNQVQRNTQVPEVHPRLAVMRAQEHVTDAIKAITQTAEQRAVQPIPNYWFKNDHTLLILDGVDGEEALRLTRHIMGHLFLSPLEIENGIPPIPLSVSAALLTTTYADFGKLAGTPAELRTKLRKLIDQLHEQTTPGADHAGELVGPGSISQRVPGGWKRMAFNPETFGHTGI